LGKIITPNQISFFTLLFGAMAGQYFMFGNYTKGAWLVLASGLVDMVDGAVARGSGQKTRFGAVLDSTFDRLSEGFIYAGLAFNHYLATLALATSFGVSYIASKESRVAKGFAERGDRLVLLALGAFFGRVDLALAVIIGLATLTIIVRLKSAHKLLGEK